MNINEYFKIATELEEHHSVFSTFWSLGIPEFTDKIPTAGIKWDNTASNPVIMINPKFWESQTLEQKKFVICHECLHVILNHGARIQKIHPDKIDVANYAEDLVINEILKSKFGFKQNEVDPKNQYIWFDGVKQQIPEIEKNKSSEYYFNVFNKHIDQQKRESKEFLEGLGSLLDSHEGHFNIDSENVKRVAEKIADRISNEEIEQFNGNLKNQAPPPEQEKSAKQAGSNAGGQIIPIKPGRVKKITKWEQVIKNWICYNIAEIQSEQWARKNRRLTTVSTNLIIPSEYDTDQLDVKRIPVWFFLDTSGSCVHHASRFFNAAVSIPEEFFELHLFCFDTKVYETDLKSKKILGRGGTSFVCIEDYIQNRIKKDKKSYPHSVFIITDGYGDYVEPQKPERWFWFLTENYKDCIPKKSKIYDLKEFEVINENVL